MINIKRFREYCIELMGAVNAQSEHKISHTVLAVELDHLVKKLKEKTGICLAVNYPWAKAEGSEDNFYDNQTAVFFIIQKLAPGNQSDEDEITNYEIMQQLMLLLRERIRGSEDECMNINPDESYKIEWEYQVFGGFNGLSMSVTFKNYD